MTEHLSSSSLAQLSEFVADRIGFHFPRERWLDLERGMRSVTRAFEFDDMDSCVQWLVSSPLTRSRIETLASHFTVGESYFFRERQSFDLLEARVLPELINKRRDTERRLRIWSAGCCTGEEPYSIAILLKRLLPDLSDWQITVLATDINPQFLKKAADGVYNEWSFRGVPAELKTKYFAERHNGRFEVLPEIKRMVTFCYLNLMEDSYPSMLNNSNAVDLIFCRNVLMYFDPERAKQVVGKLSLSLLDGGWLVVSPCEVSHLLFEQFVTVNFPGTIFYRKDHRKTSVGMLADLQALTDRPIGATPPLSFGPITKPETAVIERPVGFIASNIPIAKKIDSEETLYEKALGRYEQGFYEEASQMLATFLAANPNDVKAVVLLARVYANQGKLAEASRCSEQAVAADGMNPSCHILHATILQEQGAVPEAIRALQRALYLEPNLVWAHFALGNIARSQEKAREAARHFDNARALLDAYAPEQVLPEFDGMTAGRLMEMIRSVADGQAFASRGPQRIKAAIWEPKKPTTKRVKEKAEMNYEKSVSQIKQPAIRKPIVVLDAARILSSRNLQVHEEIEI
jgi:chemotaxis protein methyltransferase CheR